MGMAIGIMMHAMFRVLKKRTGEQTEEKLTIEQFGLLVAISCEKKEVIQKDMAEIMGKDNSTILRMIDTLEKKELVRRVADLKDRRKNYIMVSKKGERTIEQYQQIETVLSNELQEGLSPDEIETFYRVLGHMRRKAEQLNTNN